MFCYAGKDGDEVLYGTSDGKIGLVQLERYDTEKMYAFRVKSVQYVVSPIPNDSKSSSRSSSGSSSKMGVGVRVAVEIRVAVGVRVAVAVIVGMQSEYQ